MMSLNEIVEKNYKKLDYKKLSENQSAVPFLEKYPKIIIPNNIKKNIIDL